MAEIITGLHLVEKLGTLIPTLVKAYHGYNELGLEKVFTGMKAGGVPLDEFMKDFQDSSSEKKAYWAKRLKEAIDASSMKAMPCIGWLLARSHLKDENEYIFLKTAKSLSELTDEEFDYLVKIKETKELLENSGRGRKRLSNGVEIADKQFVPRELREIMFKDDKFSGEKISTLTSRDFISENKGMVSSKEDSGLRLTKLFDSFVNAYNHSKVAQYNYYGEN